MVFYYYNHLFSLLSPQGKLRSAGKRVLLEEYVDLEASGRRDCFFLCFLFFFPCTEVDGETENVIGDIGSLGGTLAGEANY